MESCDGKNITIIEGNYSDTVKRRTIAVNGKNIRGFITPDYTSKATKPEPAKETYDLQTTGQLWIRKAPVDGATIIAMPVGAKVTSLSNPWVKVRYEKIGTIYEGWSAMKYLKEI